MSLNDYVKLDLSKKSALAADLFQRMERECAQRTVVLTPVYATDGTPPFLTQEMSAWLATYIQPYRATAVQDVYNEFKHRGCKLLESELDIIEQKKLAEIDTERAILQQNKNIEFLRLRFDDLQGRYESARTQIGRDATQWTPVRYWLVLFCFMLPEFLINWDSFLKIPGFTQAYATGLILVVAIAFAFSAHSIGRVTKQWKELFGGHIDFTERKKTQRELIVGTSLFLLGLAAVGWGRWFFIQGAILEKSILRGGGLEFEDFLQFGGAMLGNILVYLLGVLWSFMKHDSVPEFSELRFELEKTQGRLIEAFNKFLTRRNQQHIQKAQKNKVQAERVDQSQKKLDGYPLARLQFAKLKNKDAEVLALLREYRNLLIATLKAASDPRTLQIEDVRVAELSTLIRLTPDQYSASQLEMRYL